MNTVMIVPTGIGAEIGGHAGDANPAAKLIASVCDTFITHPNVVNASDINEMPENTLYVEGSMLDRFLEGDIGLKRVKDNKVLVVVNDPDIKVINAVSAARATIGMDAFIVVLETPLRMIATMTEKGADGEVYGWQELTEQVKKYNFDALAVVSLIDAKKQVAIDYLRSSAGINPWGAVEAKASKLISDALDKPVAHAPLESEAFKGFNEVVDPRKAAELVSIAYMHCVMKGLHKAPQIGTEISANDIDCLITPVNCVGRPHSACMKAGIPIIAVEENKTVLNDPMPDSFIVVKNYLEAVGVIQLLKTGMTIESVTRPISQTEIK